MKDFRKQFNRVWTRSKWAEIDKKNIESRQFDQEIPPLFCLISLRASNTLPRLRTHTARFLGIALCTALLSHSPSLHAFDSDGNDTLIAALSTKEIAAMQNDTYTINFNNISMLEFLRFASKISNLNFIFEDADLQFNVSVISEEPVTAKNVLAALAQVLRIHDLILLEQDGNVIITKSARVNQVSPIVSAEQLEGPSPNALLVTRVFRIKNANPNTLASILRPMVSDTALIEVSNETRQLIITDIAVNVEQIASLLLTLDSPHSPLEIDAYTAKVVSPDELISLTQQILTPFTEGNILSFVAQKDTNSIFIVSTPHLIERALIIMEDLDIPAKQLIVGKTPLMKKNVFVYKVQNRSLKEVTEELMAIVAQMNQRGVEHPGLQQAIEGVEETESTNSLIFLADEETIAQLKTILASLDTATTAKISYFIYKIQRASESQISDSLKQLRDKLQSSTHPDAELIKTIDSMQWNEGTNSLIFTGTPSSIDKLKDLLPTFDMVATKEGPLKSTFLIYNPQYRSGEELYKAIENTELNLKESKLANPAFLQALESMKWTPSTNSLLFTGDAQSLERIRAILVSMDTPTKEGPLKSTFLIYTPQYRSGEELYKTIENTERNLKESKLANPAFLQALESMKWTPSTNSLLFTGDAQSLERIRAMLVSMDTPTKEGPLKSTFLMYTPQYRSGEELSRAIENTERNLKESKLANPAFLQTLESMKWTPSTNSLLFTGDAQSLERIQAMLVSMDTPTPFTSKTTEVFIYKPQYASPEQIQSALQGLISSLESTNSFADQSLMKAIQSMKWNPDTQTFTVTTDPSTVERLKSLLASFDSSQPGISPLSQGFYLYKLQNVKGDVVISELKQVAAKIPPSSLQNKNLIQTINQLEWMRSNNSLVITGSPDAIEQVKTLLADFDLPSGVAPPTEAQAFYIYKPQNVPAEEVLAILTDLAKNMQAAGLKDPQLFEAISSARYVQSTNSMLFAGTQESLDKIKNLVVTIDVGKPTPTVQTVGNLTFLLYKIQNASPEQFMASLKTFSNALQKSNANDAQVAAAIDNMKFIKENNSILFTGPQDALQRIESLAVKFDVGSGPKQLPTVPVHRETSTFVIYNPKYLTGEELISVMCDFMDNLVTTGISNPQLFDTINNLKWIPKTSSLLISGDKESIDQVQGLLERFDIPTGTTIAPSIQTFDNTSFLVYKLQFHTGVDIQSALKQIAMNLSKGTNTNMILSDAIDSLQWIQPTNSLIATGPQDVLVKIKELIQNIDVPLRQVFIEILVLETSLLDTQSFGLQWGSQLQYFNKTLFQTGNFPNFTPNFGNVMQGINSTTTPNSATLPFASTGFDLGVVGDIIMHKGRSFLSLGSLLNAIQTDTDTVVVINQKIVTQDNRQSTIFVGQNVPYTGSLVTNQSTSTVTTANIEYRDVGVNLTITPILGEGDEITLDIVQDISSIVGGTGGTSSTDVTGITTNHAHMETRVTVPDNKFLALTGLISDTKQHIRTAIPCLGSLPVVGFLFSQNTRSDSKGPNFIIFVRPKIINSIEDYKKITEHQEWIFKNEAGTSAGKEQFDAGLDLVKLPEDE